MMKKSVALVLLSLSLFAQARPAADRLYGKYPLKDLVITRQDPVSVKRLPDGNVIADFGKAAFGGLNISVGSPHADTVIVHLGETVRDGRVDRNPGGSVRYARYELAVSEGRADYGLELRSDPRNSTPKEEGKMQPILMPEDIGEVYPFRYVEIEGLDGAAECRLERAAVNYPFDESASYFHSSDSVLNAVWELCKYTIKATSFCGYYVDGDRERVPYEADALINQLAHYCVDSEYAMARRTADYLFTHPTWPTEWTLQSVFIAYYDYLYTGDKALIEKHYELLKAKTLTALRDENGLISTRGGKLTPEFYRSISYSLKSAMKDIVDWPRSGSFGLGKKEAGEADGYVLDKYNTVVNAFHYEALVMMSSIAGALGRKNDAKMFSEQSEAVLKAFNALLFDAEAGCYRDGLDKKGSPLRHCSLHANMLPLLFGMVPEGNRDSVLDFIRSRGMACSVYGSQYLLDALYDAYDDDYALSLLNSTSIRSWYNMIRLGSTVTLEAWAPCFKNNLDWNHAWGAAPADIIPRKLVGVTPLEPGFRKMRIRPQMGSLKEFSALVPTPRGGVRVSASRPGVQDGAEGPAEKADGGADLSANTGGAAIPETDGAAGGGLSVTVEIPSGIRTEMWLKLPSGNGSATLRVDGRRRSFTEKDGFAVFSLRPGRHECLTEG